MNLRQLRKWIVEHSDHPGYYEHILDKKIEGTLDDEVFITLTLKGIGWNRFENASDSEGEVGTWIISEMFQDYNYLFELVDLNVTFTNWRIKFIRFNILRLFQLISNAFQEVL